MKDMPLNVFLVQEIKRCAGAAQNHVSHAGAHGPAMQAAETSIPQRKSFCAHGPCSLGFWLVANRFSLGGFLKGRWSPRMQLQARMAHEWLAPGAASYTTSNASHSLD